MSEGFKVPIFPAKPPVVEEKKSEHDIPYNIPKWSGLTPSENYCLEVLKSGAIVEMVDNLQSRAFWMIGRLPVGSGVNISAAHPTISRFHAVLQYRDASTVSDEDSSAVHGGGWFIYDLDSTHGTFVNKNRIKPRIYVRVRVGHQIKFGNSTRNYILQGPTEDEEEESEFTITELKEQKAQRQADLQQKEAEEEIERERKKKEKEEAGVSWGMDEDAEEEPDLTENPYAVTNNEDLFLDDPKKTLRIFFEREGHELEYKCDELSPGVFICRVELPLDDEFGKNIICEVQHKGKKKECVVQCALESCRILDRHGVLRQSNQEPRRSMKQVDSDSDDDIFFDRTGDVERKRIKRQGPTATEALTYEQLMDQEKEIVEKIQDKEKQLESMVQTEKRQRNQNDDDLDEFMNNLSSMDDKVDKFAISHLKIEIQNLKIEHQKVQKLVNIARPSIKLPPLANAKGKLPLFGKRNVLSRNFGVKKGEVMHVSKKVEDFVVEEDEEEPADTEASQKKTESIDLENSTIGTLPKKSEFAATTLSELEEPATKKVKKAEATNPPENASLTFVASIQETLEKTTSKDPSAAFQSEFIEESTSKQPEISKESSAKKTKKRIRIRNRLRENIDMNDDDEYIDEEKVSTWVAPSDQTGDGMTHLNDKYGY